MKKFICGKGLELYTDDCEEMMYVLKQFRCFRCIYTYTSLCNGPKTTIKDTVITKLRRMIDQ
jgi:hypothetical protein